MIPTDKQNPNAIVAQFLTKAIEECGKSQITIAKEAGYANANNITMLKSGRSKLNKARVPALARSLEVDETDLMMLVLEQDEPHLADWIKRKTNVNSIGRHAANAFENSLIRAGKVDAELSQEKLKEMQDFFDEFVKGLD